MRRKPFRDPPRLPERFLNVLTDYQHKYSIAGDMKELFFEVYEKKGYVWASVWYWMHCMLAFPKYLEYLIRGQLHMILNYWTGTIRNLARHKTLSAINIIGLSIGLACCFLISLYIIDELSYDRFHENIDTIFTMIKDDHYYSTRSQNFPTPMGPAVEAFFPEVEKSIRITYEQAVVNYGEYLFNEVIMLSDALFFRIFTFPLILGDKANALSNSNSIVITQSMADKYFGSGNPLGKILSVTFGQKMKEYIVTGIMKDIPGNSSIRFNMLMNIDNLNFIHGATYTNRWDWFRTSVYVKIKNRALIRDMNKRFPLFIRQNMAKYLDDRKAMGRWDGKTEPLTISFKNLKKLHFDTQLGGHWTNNAMQSIVILVGIGSLILIIGCINFMNLSIGRSSIRSVEIGMRKVMGAGANHLMMQFWNESIIITGFAMLLGIIFASLALPAFNTLANKQLPFIAFGQPIMIGVIILLILIVGLISGSYPALIMINLRSVDLFKGKVQFRGKSKLSKSLVIVQFSLSIALIIIAYIISDQIRFMTTKELGFSKEGLVVLQIQENSSEQSRRVLTRFKAGVKEHTDIKSVSGSLSSFNRKTAMGMTEKRGKKIPVYLNTIYYDYIQTMEMELIAGRDFSDGFSTDTSAVIVNKKLIEELDLESPIGKTVKIGRMIPLTIIGIVEDFHFFSLEHEMGPSAIMMLPSYNLNYILLRISTERLADTMKIVRDEWTKIQPDKPFIYSFLSDDLAAQYKNEKQWQSIINYSSLFAVLIACMGIFGLTSIIFSRRKKEIGIRRVLGASTQRITIILLRDFIWWVFISNIIAWPAAYIIMNRWLQNYAYRSRIELGIFIVSGISVLVIVLSTVGYQALQSAKKNPIESLKYE